MRQQFRIEFTESAAAKRDALDPQRRALFEKGLAILLENPYHPLSQPIGASEVDREIRLTSAMAIEYVIAHGLLVVIVVRVYDDRDVLLPGDV
jgi:hypothetical protein